MLRFFDSLVVRQAIATVALIAGLGGVFAYRSLSAQETPPAEEAGPSAEAPPAAPAATGDDEPAPTPASQQPSGLTLYSLIVLGGWLMVPIYIFGVVATAFTFERALGLRRSKTIPNELVDALGQLANSPGGFDPRKAYRVCQQYPSATATVIRAMLLKVGRPHSEIEHTVQETSEREAARLYSNVGWITLSAAVAPLLGLFGTVWGMIVAFEQMTRLDPGANRATQLAEGIYVALITTLGGLAVAIPAVIAAHYFEGKIQSIFHEIDELLFSLLPQVERYEGRLRVSRQALAGEESNVEPPPAPAKVVTGTPK
jgi:biopolymer transport protein ExbB